MNTIKPLTFIIAMSASAISYANVTLNVPSEIEILAANEVKAKPVSGGFFSANKTLELPDGQNQIVFRYTANFDTSTERTSVASHPIIAKFNSTDSTLDFTLPNFRDKRDAEKKVHSVEWVLTDDSGEKIALAQEPLIKGGMQIGRDFERESVDYNRAGGIAALEGKQVHAVTLPAIKMKDAQNNAEEMLHFWYEKADEKTKARFKEFVNQ
ncbi:DUF2057 family protein [Vibrio makurazakiensis]|uniref:DUF2057 family protein n=1 Tax=Vibrio makurazakiensis TaxID=2910250 RepID=UPI003D0B9B18